MPELEEIIAEVKALPLAEQNRLREILNAEANRFDPAKRIAQLVAEQGTRPLRFEEMLGDFWPQEESIDEFLATLREWRSEAEHRSIES
jgi:hypothetical protein